MIHGLLSANTIRLAKVTKVWPEGQKFEAMFLDNGDYARDVQVMSPYAGTDFGFTSGIPKPENEGHEPNRKTDPNERHVIAVIATIQARHICLGFLFPQVTHMAFTRDQDMNRLIERHTSDFYRTVDDDANMEMVHPSKALIAMTENVMATPLSDNPEDTPTTFTGLADGAGTSLEGRDFDKRWKIQKNQERNVRIVLKVGRNSIIITGEAIFIEGNIFQNGIHKDSKGFHTSTGM